ncbi:LacI family DNA-binding transcriptional regulator [Gynuella sp.]|uniref:LacI family DNA-binding transcriptional regulator n=1 Tax=Gynuella sp. TaxID=2969146 RepID=UPI003D0C1188
MSRIKRITAQDVAEAAGVSRAAVSRTLSNNGYVSPAVRAKVQAAADKLGYRVNYLARGLNQQRSDIVGVVVADIDSSFRACQIRHLTETLLQYNYRPLLISTGEKRDCSQVIDMLMHYSVSGVIITSDTPPAEIYTNCIEHEVPVILINKADQHPKVDRVLCDNAKGMELLLDYYQRRHCRRLVLVTTAGDSYSIREREHLFTRLASLPYDVIRVTKHDYQGGVDAGRKILELDALPDGILCLNDYLAIGVIDILKSSLSKQVLANIKITGFDDMAQAGWLNYQLTTIHQSCENLAGAAVKLLQRRISHPQATEVAEVIDVTLVERDGGH